MDSKNNLTVRDRAALSNIKNKANNCKKISKDQCDLRPLRALRTKGGEYRVGNFGPVSVSIKSETEEVMFYALTRRHCFISKSIKSAKGFHTS